MQEIGEEYLIKNYWDRIDQIYPELEERASKREMERIKPEFVNPSEDSPVSFAEFLSRLALPLLLLRLLSGKYRRDPQYPIEAMFKALLFKEGMCFKFYTTLSRYLETHPEEALLLGFEEVDGVVRVPSSKTFWHFVNIRFKDEWHAIFRLLRDEVVRCAREMGLPVAERVTEDATPIRAKKNDPDATYSGHYKIKGYKLDTVSDLDFGLPLEYMVVPITYDEAKCLPEHIEALSSGSSVSFSIKGIWIDGGYTDLSNLAFLGIRRIEAHYRIEKNWTKMEEWSEEKIRALYQKYWRHPRFKVNADMEYILWFLVSVGRVREVGYYLRNQALENYQDDPKAYMDSYHLRSRKEGEHGYYKEQLEIEDRVTVKGQERIERYLALNLCTILAVALVRLQHGITENLTSLAYLA